MRTVPVQCDIVITRGISFDEDISFTFKDEAGELIPLDDCEVFADARMTPESGVAFSLQPEIVSRGRVRLRRRTAEETMLLKVGEYSWDLVVKWADGRRDGPEVAGVVFVENINTRPI